MAYWYTNNTVLTISGCFEREYFWQNVIQEWGASEVLVGYFHTFFMSLDTERYVGVSLLSAILK